MSDLDVQNINSKTGSSAISIADSGNVGIGTNSPTNNLTIGLGSFAAPAPNTVGIYGSASGGVYAAAGHDFVSAAGGTIYSASDSLHTWRTSSVERMRIDSSGNLLVGDTSTLGASASGSTHITGGLNSTSDVPLYLRNPYSTAGQYWKTGPTNDSGYIVFNASNTGVYVAYGATTWTSNSDEFLKENISDVGSVIDKVKNYRCVNYSLKISKLSNADKIGFIAQDWEQDFPNVIGRNAEGELGMKYTETIPVLLKAIQEQQAMIEELKAEVAALKGA